MPEMHDDYGCSRHDGIVACLQYESGPAGNAAAEGTEMHAIAEAIIKSEWKQYKFPNLFQTGNKFTDEHRVIVVSYTNAIKKLYEKYRAEYGNALEMHIEKEISIPNLEISISTIDCLFYVPFQLIHVVDLKTGRNPVLPTSHQLRSYLLGALNIGPASRYLASIVQPVCQDGMLTEEFSKMEMERHERMMSLVLSAAKRENAPCTPCKYCDWCAKNGTCPATKAKLALARINVDSTELQDTTLARLTAYGMKVKSIIGNLEQRAIAILVSGGRLKTGDGYELMIKPGRDARYWYDEKKAEEELAPLIASKLGCTVTEAKEKMWVVPDPVPPKFISPAQAEKLVGKSKAVTAITNKLIGSQATEAKEKKLIVVKSTEGEA